MSAELISIAIDTSSIDGYNRFIQCKRLPRYKVVGNTVYTDAKSYNYVFGGIDDRSVKHIDHISEFDYQRYITTRALERERFAAFLDCGLGKSAIELMFSHDVIRHIGGKGLILCPLSVLDDMQIECNRLYGYRMSNLRSEEWKSDIAIINYEAMREIDMRDVTCIVLDESSILKNADGETQRYLTDLAKNVRFRLACSATPSPNDQTEYATHAVWLGISNTVKEFYSRFFVKDGTEWRMKPHAKDAFYDFLKSWSCYIHSPSSLGFERGAELSEEPIYTIQHSFADQKYMQSGMLFSNSVDLQSAGLIFGKLRSDKSQERFRKAIDAISGRHSIIWCNRNSEEEAFARELGATVINGKTPIEKRVEIVNAFRAGEIGQITSKPSVLGFGVNIPQADSHLYTGYNFSFEEFYQAVRRSHRYGRTGRLEVIVPASEPEVPVWDALQRKLSTFKQDVSELQKRFFS